MAKSRKLIVDNAGRKNTGNSCEAKNAKKKSIVKLFLNCDNIGGEKMDFLYNRDK